MKKARILLTAIILFTFVGGVFGYKQTRIAYALFKLGLSNRCTQPVQVTYTTNVVDAADPTPIVTNIYYTIAIQVQCPLITIFKAL